MPDSEDVWRFFESLGGAAKGISTGINAGMEPLKTWETIRTSDLSNDRFETENQNYEQQQRARMGEEVPAWYGDWRDAGQSGYRATTAKNETDIFGNQQKLRWDQYITSDAAKQRLSNLKPGSADYQMELARMKSEFDPYGAVADAEKSRGQANIALNEQTAKEYFQAWLREHGPDPMAEVVRGTDGTISIKDSRTGQLHPLDVKGGGNAMVTLASMISGTPSGTLEAGMKSEADIARANAAVLTADKAGALTPAVMFNHIKEQGTRADSNATRAKGVMLELRKVKTDTMDEPTLAKHQREVDAATKDWQAAEKEARGYRAALNQLIQEQQAGGGRGGRGMGTTLNAQRFNPDGTGTGTDTKVAEEGGPAQSINDAIGMVTGTDLNARNMAGGERQVPYPRRTDNGVGGTPRNARDTGTRPIGGMPAGGGNEVVPDATGVPPEQAELFNGAKTLLAGLQQLGLAPHQLAGVLQLLARGGGGGGSFG